MKTQDVNICGMLLQNGKQHEQENLEHWCCKINDLSIHPKVLTESKKGNKDYSHYQCNRKKE